MIFANEHAFWGLLLLPILLFLIVLGARVNRNAAIRFMSPKLFQILSGTFLPYGKTAHTSLLLVAVFLLIVAAARPQYGFEEKRIQSRGIDMIVAIDVSQSMLAEDIKPNRITRAKEILQDILWSAKGNRIGVIAFAGSAQVKCPLTLDHSMAKTALQIVEVGCVGTPGTNLGNAIDASIKAFDTGSDGERVLVLLTDGEDHEASVDAAIQRSKDQGIKIFTIGIGTGEGVPIPSSDSSYKRDNEGKIVNSKLDLKILQAVATATGGQALIATGHGNAVSQSIMREIDAIKKVEQQDQTFRIYKERYYWVLIPAIFLLLFDMLLISRVNRNFRRGF